MKRTSYLFMVAAIIFMISACNKGINLDSEHHDRSLSFDLTMAEMSEDSEDMATKAMEIRSADGKIVLPLVHYVSEGIETSVFGSSTQTKGTQYNSESDLRTIGTFNATAWSSDGTRFIPASDDKSSKSSIVSYNSTSGKWTLAGTAPLWKNADVKTFFAYSNLPDGSSITCTSNASHTFSYPSIKTDATAQKDALLGYYKGNGDRDGDGTSDGVAKIQFIHPLTAVVFEQGDFEGISAIKSLSIQGVYEKGEAEVTYSYNGSKLVPAFNWGSSLTGTTIVSQTVPNSGALPGKGKKIGESFLIFPQDLTVKAVTIKAVVTTTSSGDQEIQAELNTGNWMAGKTNTYVIGYNWHTYTYEFTLSEGGTSGSQTFSNVTAESKSVPITSKKKDEEGAEISGDWLIKSVQVGSNPEEIINAYSFSGKGGISANKSGNSLSIKSTAREQVSSGVNAYWTNSSKRTDNLGWSPSDWSDEGTIDLSRMDFSTDDPSVAINAHDMTTANCYVIRHAGTYKFPLVYGNGVVNGAINEQSYYPGTTGGSNRLDRFLNHLGNGIQSPYIEYNTTDGNAKNGSNEYLAPASGTSGYEIVWQDQAEIISITGFTTENVEGKDVSFLTFTIPQDKICQNNAIIAVKDSNNKIMWSWHIWTTNDPALISGSKPVWNNSNPSVEYDFFPLYVLGWIDGNSFPAMEDVKIILSQKESGNEIDITVQQPAGPSSSSNGCWYQWGRKDPMPADDDVFGEFTKTRSATTLLGAIQNPGSFYWGSNDWLSSDHFYNLWTGKKSAAGFADQDNTMIKTVYDPSPIGYKVPASNAFTGFTTSGGNTSNISECNVDGSFHAGWNYFSKPGKKGQTIFFPAAGARKGSKDEIELVGTFGYYWTATPEAHTNNACRLVMTNDSVNPLYYRERSYAYSIRPVLE